MSKRPKSVLVLGIVPFLALVFALPFVNRIEPVILGLPFILFWILFWVAVTPLILGAAYRIERKSESQKEGDDR
jgi:hypothetical protein